MKYEAKIDNRGGSDAKAVSKASGRPTTRVSYKEALSLCQNNGSRYDLIRNSQWQNIALSIESVDENWSQGRSTPSDNNILNCGVFYGTPKEASSKDKDDCASSSCDSDWHRNKRTHILENGERIWDICGNVGEIMKDKYRENDSFDDHVYNLSYKLKRIFGPKKTYKLVNADRRSKSWNLGYATIKKDKDMIIRGLPGREGEAGIFSVDVTSDQTDQRRNSNSIGFRCVYIP